MRLTCLVISFLRKKYVQNLHKQNKVNSVKTLENIKWEPVLSLLLFYEQKLLVTVSEIWFSATSFDFTVLAAWTQ